MIGGVLAVAVQRKAGNVAPAVPLVVEHRPHIRGQILQIPLVDQAVDLTRLFPGRVLRIDMIQHRDEPHAPLREQPVQVALDQLHITGEARLGFRQNDLEFARLRIAYSSCKSKHGGFNGRCSVF